jgi:hypothetical protein
VPRHYAEGAHDWAHFSSARLLGRRVVATGRARVRVRPVSVANERLHSWWLVFETVAAIGVGILIVCHAAHGACKRARRAAAGRFR